MIIGILGLAGSGKTTVADTLAAKLKCPVISVAAPIKSMLLGLGLQPGDFTGKAKERTIGWIGKSPRQLMQSLGDWGREQNANVWATLMEERMPHADPKKRKPGHVIVDDIRLPLEAAVIRRRGGYLLRVTRPGQTPTGHMTERAGQLIEADYEIINSAGLDSLKQSTLDWLEETL